MKTYKIYTKSGDKGKTSLIGGTRVEKFDLQVEAYGTIDELKSYTALVYDLCEDKEIKTHLFIIIEKLFIAESLVASDNLITRSKMPQLTAQDIEVVENYIDKMTAQLPPLTAFLLPGGDVLASQCNIARAVCRRAERAYLRYCSDNETNEFVAKYLNRLSDYYFTLSRYIAKKHGIKELLWLPNK